MKKLLFTAMLVALALLSKLMENRVACHAGYRTR